MKSYTMKHVCEVCGYDPKTEMRKARALVDLVQPANGRWRRFNEIDLLRFGILAVLHRDESAASFRRCDAWLRERADGRNSGRLVEVMGRLVNREDVIILGVCVLPIYDALPLLEVK